MLRNYLKIALRQLWRNRVFTLLNIVGLATGLAAITLVYWQLEQVLTYDTHHPHAERLFSLQQEMPGESEYYNTVVPLLPVLLREMPVIETGTRLFCQQNSWINYGSRDVQTPVYHADTSVFSVFVLPLRAGNPRTALNGPNSVVLSEKLTKKLFGTTTALGKTVLFDNGRAYVVRGVLAHQLTNTTIQPEAILSIADLEATNPDMLSNWYNGVAQTYIRLRPGLGQTPPDYASVEASLQPFVQKYYSTEARNRILRLTPIAQSLRKSGGPLLTIILYGLGFIALFILFIVLINFLNLTSALSLTRLNEVSVRRVLGANRRELIGQFILEAALVAGVGVGLGALLLQASLPHYISFFGIETMFAPRLSWNTLPFLLAIVALLGILGGLVPGLYLASQRFMGSWQEKTRSLRIPFQSSLVVVQFTLATILMACTGIMLVQNRFVKTQSTGFQVAHRLLIPLNRAYRNPVTAEVQISGLLMQLRHHPDVVQFSTNSSVPGTNLTSSNLFSLPVKSEYWMC